MPEPRALNISVFLDEVNEFNGPLYFIPKSHKKRRRIEAKHDPTTTSHPLWVIDNDTIAKLVEQGGIVAPKGLAGSADLLPWHPCARQPAQHVAMEIARSSTSRTIPVKNAIRAHKQARNTSPITTSRRSMPVEDDCVTCAARRKAAAE